MTELVEDAEPVRVSEVPKGSKSALAGIVPGMLKLVGNPITVVNFLGDRFYGKALKLDYEDSDTKYSIEYRNPEQLNDAVDAIERLAKIKVSVVNVTKLDG